MGGILNNADSTAGKTDEENVLLVTADGCRLCTILHFYMLFHSKYCTLPSGRG